MAWYKQEALGPQGESNLSWAKQNMYGQHGQENAAWAKQNMYGGAAGAQGNAAWLQHEFYGAAGSGHAQPAQGGLQIFPVQVGPPTEYAKSRRVVFACILVYQALMGIMAMVEFLNFVSGVLLLFTVMVGLHAWWENSNVTYVCWWGVLSLVGFIVGLVFAFLGFAVLISTLVIKFNIPFSCLCACLLSWWMYKDYEETHECHDMVGNWLKSMGLIHPYVPPAGNNPFLPHFGGAGDAAKEKYAAASAAASAQAAGVSGWLSNIGAEYGAATPLQQGSASVMKDPFLTH